LPEEYIPNLNARLSLYRRLAKIGCIEEIEDVSQELKDRFGNLPQPVKNLLYIVKIKVLASRAGVDSIYTQGKQVVLNFAQGKKIGLPSLYKYKDVIKVGTKQIRLDTKRLGNKWQEELERLLTKQLGQYRTHLPCAPQNSPPLARSAL
jgi:transcription-repair coupling factor (superfamily II helicase)